MLGPYFVVLGVLSSLSHDVASGSEITPCKTSINHYWFTVYDVHNNVACITIIL